MLHLFNVFNQQKTRYFQEITQEQILMDGSSLKITRTGDTTLAPDSSLRKKKEKKV